MDKEDVVRVYVCMYIYTYTHTVEHHSATEKNEMMPFAATWMDLEIIILSKSDKERQLSYDITYTWNLQK